MMRSLFLLVAASLTACVPGPGVAEPATGCARFGYRAMELRGRVTDEATGEPIRGASVRRVEGRATGLLTTNERGEYRFRSLPVDQHTIEVLKAGYYRERRDVGVLDDDTLRRCDQDTAAVLNFTLRTR